MASITRRTAGGRPNGPAALIHQLGTSYESPEQVRHAREVLRQAAAEARLSLELSPENNRMAEEILSESDTTIERLDLLEREFADDDAARRDRMRAAIRDRCRILWWKSRTERQDLTPEEAQFFDEHECSQYAPR